MQKRIPGPFPEKVVHAGEFVRLADHSHIGSVHRRGTVSVPAAAHSDNDLHH